MSVDDRQVNEWWVVVRCDGKEVAMGHSRHDARGIIARCHGCRSEWYNVERVVPVPWWTPAKTPDFDTHPGVGVHE